MTNHCQYCHLYQTPKHISNPGRLRLPRPATENEDPIVRTGSALFEEERKESDQTDDLHRRDMIKNLQDHIDRLTHENCSLRSAAEKMKNVLADYQAENNRLLSRERVSFGVSAVKDTSSQLVEAAMECTTCSELRILVDRYKNSASEASRLGEELAKSLEDRDKLRNEVKRLKSSQSQERIKLILKENDNLKEALKKRFPSNYTSLMSGPSQVDSELVAARDTVKELEIKLDRVDDQWRRRLETLRVNHETVKLEYEKTISSLLERKQVRYPPPPPPSVSPDYSGGMQRENEVLKKRVRDLESRIESLKHFHHMKAKKLPAVSPTRFVLQRFHALIAEPAREAQDMTIACPPSPDREISLNEWANLLRSVQTGHDRCELASDLSASDYRKSGLIDRNVFNRYLSYLPTRSIQTLVEVYGFGDDQVDYKSFLSDLATRSNVFISDVDLENRTLRSHVQSLMTELKDRIESVETTRLVESLENAQQEIQKKDSELKMYKAELNRFLSRNIRRVSLGE